MLMPELDDRNYDDLVQEGLILLPVVAPGWTNHNPSDPGITLVELLAYITEMLVYRLGRISPASKLQFLKLLKGANWEGLAEESKARFLALLASGKREDWESLAGSHSINFGREIDCAIAIAGVAELDAAIGYVTRDLMCNECAVTARDFEQIARKAALDHLGPECPVNILCVPSVNLEADRVDGMKRAGRMDRKEPDAFGHRAHISVIVAPIRELDEASAADLREKIKSDLCARSLLTTRVHVVAPLYLHVSIRATIAPKPGRSVQQISDAVNESLQRRFSPQPGQETQARETDDNRAHRPFGKPLHIAELIETIDETTGVDYVEHVHILQMSDSGRNLAEPGAALGVQVGLRSTVGIDTLLGGQKALGSERLLRNDEGKLVSILLRPWELLRLSLVVEDAHFLEARGIGGRDE
jgi:hypothetical protein